MLYWAREINIINKGYQWEINVDFGSVKVKIPEVQK
jgi:hypothetical protein